MPRLSRQGPNPGVIRAYGCRAGAGGQLLVLSTASVSEARGWWSAWPLSICRSTGWWGSHWQRSFRRAWNREAVCLSSTETTAAHRASRTESRAAQRRATREVRTEPGLLPAGTNPLVCRATVTRWWATSGDPGGALRHFFAAARARVPSTPHATIAHAVRSQTILCGANSRSGALGGHRIVR